MSKQVRLTLPDDLYTHLEAQAKKDDRTVANYILHLLKNPPTTPPHIYFPPGVRTPVTPTPVNIPDIAIPKTFGIPENPDRETNRDL